MTTEREPRVEVVGRAFHRDGRYLDGDALADYALASAVDHARFAAAVTELDGHFALIVRTGTTTFAAVDRTRSIPVFVLDERHGQPRVGRDPYELLGTEPAPDVFSSEAVAELLITSYVLGPRTLHPAVTQLSAGETLAVASSGEVERARYHRYGRRRPMADDPRAEVERVALGAVDRLLQVANGRTIALPLSGGRDSRMLAVELARRRHPTIAFTYGRPGNAEAVVSEQVAAGLGMAWHFVPYDEALWARWFASDARRAYYRMADGLTSVPHPMDAPAVEALVERGVLGDHTLVVPGHSADLPAGSRSLYVPDIYDPSCRNPQRVVDAVLNYHFCLYDWSREFGHLRPRFESGVRDVLHALGGVESVSCLGDVFESWDWQERQAKLIVNAVRVYEHHGLEWWCPWWDRDFVEAWSAVPPTLRQGKRLWDEIVDAATVRAGVEIRPNGSTRRAAIQRLARGTVRRHPSTFRLAREAVRWLRRRRVERHYRGHPMAWYGMVDEATFARHFTGRESILALLALERVGRL